MRTILIKILDNSIIHLNLLRVLLKIHQNNNNLWGINSRFDSTKWITFVLNSKNSRVINHLKYFFKLVSKKKKLLNLYFLEKNNFFCTTLNRFRSENYNCFPSIFLKKNVYIFIKKKRLFVNFNVLSSFMKNKNPTNELMVQLYNMLHITYFLQSISDEIMSAGKIKFFYEKKNFIYKKYHKKYEKYKNIREYHINCKQMEKIRTNQNKLFSLFFYKRKSTINSKNLIETIGNFFYLKTKKNVFHNKLITFFVKTKQINNFIFTNAFLFTEFN